MTDEEKLMKYSLKVQRKGRLRYSLEQGLIFGGLCFLVGNLFNLDEKSFVELYLSLRGLLTFAALFIAGFAIYWTLMWKMNERTIQHLKSPDEKTDSH